jgi:hypothetical protein
VDGNKLLVFNQPFPEMHHLAVKLDT